MEYVVIFEKGDSSYGAYVPDLPGCIAVGETLEETQKLIDEAIEFHIEGLQEEGEVVPPPSLKRPNQINIPRLGKHQIIETYVYDDYPVLFSCKDAVGSFYLVTVAENDKNKTWLRVGISNDRLNLIRSGGIDLRNAFTDAENDFLLQIRDQYDDQTQSSLEFIPSNQISEDILPLPGERLGLKTDTLPALSNPQAIESFSVRELLTIACNFVGVFRSEAPIAPLGKSLDGLQKVIYRIGAKCVNITSKKIPEDIKRNLQISLLEVGAGSFEMRLASTEYVGIFNDSNIGKAISEFVKILNSGSDQDQLKSLMEQFGPKVAKDYTNFLKPLSESVMDTKFTWTSPNPSFGDTVQLSNSQMQEVIDILETIQKEVSETIKILGTLVGISLRSKTFQIETTDENYFDENYFRGKISEDAFETDTVRNATLSQTYTAEIQGFVERSETTDEIKIKYRLLSLSR